MPLEAISTEHNGKVFSMEDEGYIGLCSFFRQFCTENNITDEIKEILDSIVIDIVFRNTHGYECKDNISLYKIDYNSKEVLAEFLLSIGLLTKKDI